MIVSIARVSSFFFFCWKCGKFICEIHSSGRIRSGSACVIHRFARWIKCLNGAAHARLVIANKVSAITRPVVHNNSHLRIQASSTYKKQRGTPLACETALSSWVSIIIFRSQGYLLYHKYRERFPCARELPYLSLDKRGTFRVRCECNRVKDISRVVGNATNLTSVKT